MARYAIYESDVILNVIVADSLEIAEETTGMNAIEVDREPWIGWTLIDGVWTAPPEPIIEEVITEDTDEEAESLA